MLRKIFHVKNIQYPARQDPPPLVPACLPAPRCTYKSAGTADTLALVDTLLWRADESTRIRSSLNFVCKITHLQVIFSECVMFTRSVLLIYHNM